MMILFYVNLVNFMKFDSRQVYAEREEGVRVSLRIYAEFVVFGSDDFPSA
jgi:hypothetical protein